MAIVALGVLGVAAIIGYKSHEHTAVNSPHVAVASGLEKSFPKLKPAATETTQPRSADVVWDADWRRLSGPVSPEENHPDSDLAEKKLFELHPADRIAFVAAALTRAAQSSPAEAVRAAISFCDEDPSYSLEYGRALISTLSATRDFNAALRFVIAQESDGWLGENGQKWLTTLFTSWATTAPAEAAMVAQRDVTPGMRDEALQTIAAVWVKSDPAALANFVWQLSPSRDRDQVLSTALERWKEADSAAANRWISAHSPAAKSNLSVGVGYSSR